jgi:hypothetical protein
MCTAHICQPPFGRHIRPLIPIIAPIIDIIHPIIDTIHKATGYNAPSKQSVLG